MTSGLAQAFAHVARPSPRAGLGPLLASWIFAGLLVLMLVIQNVGQYSTLTTATQTAPAAAAPAAVQVTPPVLGVEPDLAGGRATLKLARFTSPAGAATLGQRYGMDLIGSFPAFGRYI
jgi:hypothetical protein